MGFPGRSDGEESACNVEDLGSTPGLGTSPGEGIGYPLQSSWASLLVQTVKNPPAMRERPGFNPWVGKIPWRREQYFCLENSMDRGAWQATVLGFAESDMTD